MSERKSWDVVRKPAKAQPQAAPNAHPVATHAPTLSNGPRRGTAKRAPAKPLREKRQKQKRAYQRLFFIFIAALIAGAFYILWLPALRVHAIDATGPDAEGARAVTTSMMLGTYAYIVPRNSIFFLPVPAIRAQILKTYPDVEAVSIKPESLDAIRVITSLRATAFVWCGSSIDATTSSAACFDADADGLIFAPYDATAADASSTLRIFAPLDQDIVAAGTPVRAHVVASKQIPDALRLLKALRGLGANVSALSIQGDEGDFYLNGPTKIRYVLGHEEQAAELAASALPTLNLTDGSIDYVDLRFTTTQGQPGKVYVKKFGQ